MTYANIAAIWALALCLVATGWTHEQGYQESVKPVSELVPHMVRACKGIIARAGTPAQ